MASNEVVSRILKAPYDILTSMADITEETTEDGNTVTYMGFLRQTSNENGKTNAQLRGAECWLIIKLVVVSSTTHKYFCEGETTHDKEWDERAAYNYYYRR